MSLHLLKAAEPLAFLSLPLLAKLPDPQSSESIGWLMVAGGALLVIIKNASDLYRSWFVKSPADHDTFATKADVLKLEAEVDGDVSRVEHRLELWATELRTKIDQQDTTSSESREQTERALGRIEGKIDALRVRR